MERAVTIIKLSAITLAVTTVVALTTGDWEFAHLAIVAMTAGLGVVAGYWLGLVPTPPPPAPQPPTPDEVARAVLQMLETGEFAIDEHQIGLRLSQVQESIAVANRMLVNIHDLLARREVAANELGK